MRDEWRAAILRSPTLNDRTKLVLVVLAGQMTEDGMIQVERGEVAGALGWLHVQRVSERCTEARSKGFLELVSAGGRGRATRFRAAIPSGQLGRKEVVSVRAARTPTETMPSGDIRTETSFPSGLPGALLKVTAQASHGAAAPSAVTAALGSGSSSPNPRPTTNRRPRGRLGPRPAPITPTPDHQEIA